MPLNRNALQNKRLLYADVILCAVLCSVILLSLGLPWGRKHLTYHEFKDIYSNGHTNTITTDSAFDGISQEFVMPYDMIEGISLTVHPDLLPDEGSFAFKLIDQENKTIVDETVFVPQICEDGRYYFNLADSIRVRKGEAYLFSIEAEDTDSGLAASSRLAEELNLQIQAQDTEAPLSVRVYGGDADFWWSGFVLSGILWIVIIAIRKLTLIRKEKPVFRDVVLQAIVLALTVFILRALFCQGMGFTDENDNIRGGMIIADGSVLYRDYITQHMPVAYYICALFALMGASSIEQFRLCYYALEGIIWALLYYRHADYFGRFKISALPVLIVVCVTILLPAFGFMILSEGIQALSLVALLLEYFRYIDDGDLGWKRSILLSICIWGCFGTVFLSAYPLAVIFALVLIKEIKYWKKGFSGHELFQRYKPFAISIVIPFLIACFYFGGHHSLKKALEQAYTFNRYIYPFYLDGFGSTVFQPAREGIQAFLDIVASSFRTLSTQRLSVGTVLPFTIASGVNIASFRLIHIGKTFECIGPFFAMLFAGSRGFDSFHGMAAWAIAVFIIVMGFNGCLKKSLSKSLAFIAMAILVSNYFNSAYQLLLTGPEYITELESEVIALTEDDDNKDIFMDCYSCDSIYLYDKGRRPVNSVVYMMPWYMDRYEECAVMDLLEKRPGVVVYNIDRSVWGYEHFNDAFDSALQENYVRLSNDASGWKSLIWLERTRQ